MEEKGGDYLIIAVVILIVAWMVIRTIFWFILLLMNFAFSVLILLAFPSLAVWITIKTFQQMRRRRFALVQSTVVPILIAGLGISFGFGCKLGFREPLVLAAIFTTGIPLAALIFYLPLYRARLIARYRQSEQYLIKP